jgi:molybdopterin/thiamine biosynthesis adenylyltransferase
MMNSIELEFFSSKHDPRLQTLLNKQALIDIKDIFKDCLEELFEIEHPEVKPADPIFEQTKENYLLQWQNKGNFDDQGVWVYYPWSKIVIHLPDEDTFIKLRTSRNRNLITTDEQKVFQSKCVGVAGMSVGSNILNTLVLIGGPRYLKIADMDIISVPNLNRLMAPTAAVGMNKAVYFARRSLEVDPFLKIDVFSKGLNPSDFKAFFEKPRLDLFIEEVDNPYLKIVSRKYARNLGIPVVMAADNGDGALIDIERFDQEPKRPLFHGRLDKYDLNDILPEIPFPKKLAMIADMVHLEEATPRAQDSLEQVGKTLNTWPQLGTAALTAGVALTFAARRILLGEPMPSGRYKVAYEDDLVSSHQTLNARLSRWYHTKKVMKRFNTLKRKLGSS